MKPEAVTPTQERSTYDDEISLSALATLLLSGRRTLVRSILLGASIGVLVGILSRPVFKSSASFISQESTSSMPGGLASLAGQFGFSIPGSGGSASPAFYQELLTSREVLESVVGRSYAVPRADGESPEQIPLLDLLEVDGDTEAERIDRGIEVLREDLVSSSVGLETNVISLSVSTHWPDVSYQLSSALLDAMQAFNLETRRSQAQAEREFLDERVAAAKEELKSAEDALQDFLQQNRQFSNSPELQFRYDRLQREVTMRQQVYSGLMEAYEQARIREVRDTPVITVLEYPIVPPRREPRGTVLKGLLGLILGGMVGLGIVFVREATSQQADPDAEALSQAWEETRADLRRLVPWRRGA